MAVIGIDLGTTNSLAGVWQDGKVVLIPNAFGEYLTPSVVSIGKNQEVFVGSVAKEMLATQPYDTFREFKRNMGTNFLYGNGRKKYRAEELSAFVLRRLKEDAEKFLGEEVTEAVISVPAYFDDNKRNATKNAGRLAGLKIERLINEPSAVALKHHTAEKGSESFIVFDFGGGTLDVSLVEAFDNVVEIQAVAGDNYLGGKDFNEIIAQDFYEQNQISEAYLTKNEIEPTGEISEIRAAYARQVKKYHPEDTPEEFEQLQKAYKSALRQARAAKRTETVPQSAQESQKSGSGFEKRDMPGFFENVGMTEEPEKPNAPSWENTGSMSGVTSEPGTTPDLEIAGTPDEVESEIVSDSEYDFAEVGKDEPEQQCLKEIEYIIMNPYLRNTEEAWRIFFNRERYRQLFKQQEFCEKMQDRICRMWGLQRKTLFLIEQQFKAEDHEQLIEKKEWKQKKSFIRNLHIISYKNKKTQKQKNLNKLLENQTTELEAYMDLYMDYAFQSYNAVYEEYRINRCQFKQMLISIIILILFMITGICANRSVQKSAAQKRQEQQQERYVDGLKKSVKTQKSNQ